MVLNISPKKIFTLHYEIPWFPMTESLIAIDLFFSIVVRRHERSEKALQTMYCQKYINMPFIRLNSYSTSSHQNKQLELYGQISINFQRKHIFV